MAKSRERGGASGRPKKGGSKMRGGALKHRKKSRPSATSGRGKRGSHHAALNTEEPTNLPLLGEHTEPLLIQRADSCCYLTSAVSQILKTFHKAWGQAVACMQSTSLKEAAGSLTAHTARGPSDQAHTRNSSTPIESIAYVRAVCRR